MKTFFLHRLNGVSKHLSSYTDFKNVHLTLEESAHKKEFCLNTYFSGTFLDSFWGCTFYEEQICIFETGMKILIFWYPHQPCLRKSFHLLEGTGTVQGTGLRFSEAFQNFMPYIEIMKFCQKSLVPILNLWPNLRNSLSSFCKIWQAVTSYGSCTRDWEK